MKDKTCCFTGHRDIPVHQRDRIYKALKLEIIKLIESGSCYFGVGGSRDGHRPLRMRAAPAGQQPAKCHKGS